MIFVLKEDKMQKNMLVLTLLLAVGLAACDVTQIVSVEVPSDTTKKDTTKTPPDTTKRDTTVRVTGITLSPSSVSLSVGQACPNTSQQLLVNVLPSNASNQAFTFSMTAHGTVVLGSNGLLTAMKAGTDTVTVTSVADASKKATAVVTVTSTSCVPVGGITITLNPPNGTGIKGSTAQVIAIVTAPAGVDKSVIWYSTDPSRVVVAQKDGDNITVGNVILFTNVKGGTLYFVFPGSAQICAQSVVDPTVRACGQWTTQ